VELTKTYHILNLGAGVQSTALYLMFLQGGFDQKLDYAIFADTQEEPESVYKHLVWLRSLGGPPILTDTAGKLGDDLIHGKHGSGQRFASIPAFTSATPGQTGGMLRRQCTAEYKIDVCERIIRRQVVGLEPRQRMPKGIKIVQYFGLSYDEPRRVSKVKNRFVGHPWGEGRFPLFDLEITRSDCVAYLKEQQIPHEVPRSACVFCPFKSNEEWRLLRENDPQGWARAVEVDEALRTPGSIANRNMNQSIYLHRSCLPLVGVDLGVRDVGVGVAQGECEGMCGL
jgi:hypothetical protein